MSPAFFIVGPTAVGKTSLAVELAVRHGAEIVSADAFQVYRGFDLLSAEPPPEPQRRVPHHLVGCVPPAAEYNVALYLDAACQRIEETSRRQCPVIVVGGSGLYVKALTHGLAPLPAADAALREKLESRSNSDLLSGLRQLDLATAIIIDRHNKRRLVRALEVCLVTGKPFSSFRQQWETSPRTAPSKGVFLFRDRPDQIARITSRVQTMFDQGVLDEVRTSPTPSTVAGQILGLRQIQAHLAGQITASVCREQLEIATRQYAKRQQTWFKRETCFEAVNASTFSDPPLLEHVENRYVAWRSSQKK